MSTIIQTSIIDLHSKKSFISNNSHLLAKDNSSYTIGLANEFISICEQYEQDERWIIMIDPQEKDIAILNQSEKINRSKILRINSKKVKLDPKSIEKALAKGNCSAIVLCDSQFAQQQISSFYQYARQGNTQCIVLNSAQKLH